MSNKRYEETFNSRTNDFMCRHCGGDLSDHKGTPELFCPMPPTPAMVERLKENWKRDQCWDIENTEGYEDYKEELLAFRLQTEKETEERLKKNHERYASKLCPMSFSCNTFGNCQVELCAWWDGNEYAGKCAILSIGRNTERE